MCGIVGYIGYRPVMSILLNGLERLEYRGYDSSGVAVIHNHSLWIQKKKGKIRMLKQQIHGEPGSTVGIGHTRWATHGVPSDANAHPHTDCTGRTAIVNNGIIENYSVMKK